MIAFRKEVEIRLKIDGNIVSKLDKIKMEPHEEMDEYFLTRELVDKRNFLRLRKKNGRIFLELKMITLGGKDIAISEADEIEIELTQEQYEKVKNIFSVIFPINVQVEKIRSKGMLNDCELCYDNVKGLGNFLEIEGPKEKILEICKDFNIDVEKQKDREEGYTMMMLRKKGFI